MEIKEKKVVVITGPTATGKTALGVMLGKMYGGEVISADSMQIYKHMNIGTAKPNVEEMEGVPHHMLDIVEPEEEYSVSLYVEDAAEAVEGVLSRGKLPLIVGGTGLYIDSLVSGRFFSPRQDADLRREIEEEYEEKGGEKMLEELIAIDPQAGERLHFNDKKRIVRATEIYRVTGKTIWEHNEITKSVPPRYQALKFALNYENRQDLYDRIDNRVDIMMAEGLLEETKGLLDMGVGKTATSMQAIGYKELAEYLEGRTSLEEAIDLLKRRSRRYAKRQLTWLRRQNDVNWINWDGGPDMEMAKDFSTKYLKTAGYI